jgi:hypothetical protein
VADTTPPAAPNDELAKALARFHDIGRSLSDDSHVDLDDGEGVLMSELRTIAAAARLCQEAERNAKQWEDSAHAYSKRVDELARLAAPNAALVEAAQYAVEYFAWSTAEGAPQRDDAKAKKMLREALAAQPDAPQAKEPTDDAVCRELRATQSAIGMRAVSTSWGPGSGVLFVRADEVNAIIDARCAALATGQAAPKAPEPQGDDVAACPYGGEIWAPEHVTGGQWDPRVKCGDLGQLCAKCVRDFAALQERVKDLESQRNGLIGACSLNKAERDEARATIAEQGRQLAEATKNADYWKNIHEENRKVVNEFRTMLAFPHSRTLRSIAIDLQGQLAAARAEAAGAADKALRQLRTRILLGNESIRVRDVVASIDALRAELPPAAKPEATEDVPIAAINGTRREIEAAKPDPVAEGGKEASCG